MISSGTNAPSRLLLSLLLAWALLAGCGSEAPDRVLRMGLADAPQNLDPRFATDATSERINRLLYRRLTEFDEESLPIPSLAQWETLGPTHYRFTLTGEGRTFSDGTRLTADDVKATYESVLDPSNGSPHRAVLDIIRKIRTNGPDRVDFMLRKPDPMFPAYLGIGILPARLIRADHGFNHSPVGSGPFRLSDWPEAGRLRLERRRDGQRLELLTVKEPNVRVMKLLRGEIHLLQNDLPPELIGYLRSRDEVVVAEIPGINFSYVGLNLQDPGTSKLDVRRAIAHAIDRESIVRHVLQGAARLAESLLPPEHWAGARGLTPHEYDPELARSLLAAAGYGDERPLTLSFKTSSNPFRIRLATVIQAQLKEAGVNVQVQSYDWGTFFDDIKSGRFQLYSLMWVGIRNPDIFRDVFHSASTPPDGANRGRYHSPAADHAIETARSVPELGGQAAPYRQLQELLHTDLPYVPLWYENQISAARRNIRGYRLAPDGNYDGLADVEL